MILFTPGEEAADQYTGYLTNKTLTGRYAQEVKGAVVMIERMRLLFASSPRGLPKLVRADMISNDQTDTGETRRPTKS